MPHPVYKIALGVAIIRADRKCRFKAAAASGMSTLSAVGLTHSFSAVGINISRPPMLVPPSVMEGGGIKGATQVVDRSRGWSL
jgi:hypothetical protein